jgi:hypothetical protein
MRGFDTKALILFPKWENYNSKGGNYKYQFKKAVSNLIMYLQSMNIEPHVFYTDDVARELRNPEFVWVSTLSKTDRFFIKNHCDACSDALSLPMIEFDKIYNTVLAKDPGSLDMTENERFEMVLRHASKAAASIIPQYSIVIHFMFQNRQQYKVSSKPGDGKIRINVSANTFSPKVYIGGSEEDACDLLAVPYANRCLDVWEVK